MSAPSKTPDKLTNKEKHNRESVKTLLKRDYNTVTEADLEESTEVIERSELDEPPEVPNMKELKAASKSYDSGESAGVVLRSIILDTCSVSRSRYALLMISF